jgi:FkbM family methyltransferase
MLGVLRRRLLEALPGPVAGRLRAWWLRRLIRRFPARIAAHAYGGGTLRVHLGDPLAVGWYDHDWDEAPEIPALRDRGLRAGALVFDAGAHQGVVAMMLAREVGPTGRVVAVEANPHNAAVARTNRDLNAMPQIEVVDAAVSDSAGTVAFDVGLNGRLETGNGAYGRRIVPSVTLDDLTRRYGAPAVVLLDVEGAEGLALAGAHDTLASGADFCVEMHVGCGLELLGSSVDRVLAYFPEERFMRLVRAENDTAFRPLIAGDPLVSTRFFLLALSRPASGMKPGRA